ncbi:MAG: DUF2254 domain-containing protein [Myxococcota bacterium]|nr:DUF2254 domain-containing protein [Myxococcota bacterium]
MISVAAFKSWLNLATLRNRLRTSLWLFPVAGVILAVVLARILLAVDHHLSTDREAWFLYRGQADSARELLSTIASSLLTFTGLVFSITILVLQLASSQYSSRVLRTFLEDRFTKFAMATFVGSFVFAMVILPEVRSEASGQAPFVPALSTFIAFLLVLLSVGVFIRYIHQMAHSIRAVQVVGRLAKETCRSLERMYPEMAKDTVPANAPVPDAPPDRVLFNDGPAGALTEVGEDRLVKLACDRGLVLWVVPEVGDFVPRGAPLFRIWGQGEVQLDELRESVVLGEERTPRKDPAFGFRQLVDVAERALSPGINDPSTAVQVLDQLHDLLRTLATREFPSPCRLDDRGVLRLVVFRPSWDDYVSLAMDEIRGYGENSLQIARRLGTILKDLLSVAPPYRQPILLRQQQLLRLSIQRGFPSEPERRLADSAREARTDRLEPEPANPSGIRGDDSSTRPIHH